MSSIPVAASMTISAVKRGHQQERSFHCPVPHCGGRFHRKFTLHEHMKTHTGEQPHQCPVKSCGKRFSTSGNLARHKRLHTLHKLECPVSGCMRIFTSTEMLDRHQKVHLGSAVHSCDMIGCGKTFSTAGNLTRHMKTQHKIARDQKCNQQPHSPASSTSSSSSSTIGSPGNQNNYSFKSLLNSPSMPQVNSPCEEFPMVEPNSSLMFMTPPPSGFLVSFDASRLDHDAVISEEDLRDLLECLF